MGTNGHKSRSLSPMWPRPREARPLDGDTVELKQGGAVEPGAVNLAVEQDSEGIPLVSITKVVTGEHVATVIAS